MALTSGMTAEIAEFVYGQISACEERVASAIALSLNIHGSQRTPGDRGGLEVTYGTVAAVTNEATFVALDSDSDHAVPMLATGTVFPGDRVAVLLVPPSSAIVLGGLAARVVANPQVETVSWSAAGAVQTVTGGSPWTAPWPGIVLAARLHLKTAPGLGDSCVIDLNRYAVEDGTTASIWTDSSRQPTAGATDTDVVVEDIDTPLFDRGDQFFADVDVAGGDGLTVQMDVRPR